MAQARLTPRHKEMLTSLAEALKTGEMGIEWILSTSAGGIAMFCFDKHDANPAKLNGWNAIQHGDIRKFADLGLLRITRYDDHRFPDYLIFDEAEILHLVDNNFEADAPQTPAPAITITSPNSIVNVQTTLNNSSQVIHNSPNIREEDKLVLENLIRQLKEGLAGLPSEYTDDGETVAVYADRLVQDASNIKPNTKTIQISAEGLRKAAQNIAMVATPVITIVEKILTLVGRLH